MKYKSDERGRKALPSKLTIQKFLPWIQTARSGGPHPRRRTLPVWWSEKSAGETARQCVIPLHLVPFWWNQNLRIPLHAIGRVLLMQWNTRILLSFHR